MPRIKYKKRADGRYLSQITVGYKNDGRPLLKNVYAKTVPELESKIAIIRRQIDTNTLIYNESITLEKWAAEWLDVYKTGVSINTKKMYASAINAYIIPGAGKYKLKDIRAFNLQKIISSITNQGKYRTAEIVSLTLKQILEKAKENHYIHENPASHLFTVKNQKRHKQPLTDEEVGRIFEADFTPKEKIFLYVLLYTGVRKGEALALTKNDIDTKKKVIKVSKTIIYESNAAILKSTPKSSAGNREIPIPDIIFDDLEKYIKRLKSIYLFPNATSGSAMSASSFRHFWRSVIKKVDELNKKPLKGHLITKITPHLLRHTYATMLYYAGVDIKTASYYLGHASTRMTIDVYTHLQHSKNIETIEKINSHLSKTKNINQSPRQSND